MRWFRLTKSNIITSYARKIKNFINQKAPKIAEQVGKDVSTKLRDYIQRYWYDTYSPQDYERSHSLLEAVVYERHGSYVNIYIDESKLAHAQFENNWNQHMSFDAVDFGAGLIQFIENGVYNSGLTGSINNPRIGDASHAIERTNKWIARYIKEEIKRKVEIELGCKFQ